jgi:hypothetical protein
MTALDDRGRIRDAKADEAHLRRQCLEGTDKYWAALNAAGYLLAPRKAA